MVIHDKPIDFYLDKIRNNDYFAFPGYSDAEWLCMMKIRVGENTAFGQKIDAVHGNLLLDIIRRRQHDPRWLFAVPRCLLHGPIFGVIKNCPKDSVYTEMDAFLEREGIANFEPYERDKVTDYLAMYANLYPLIQLIRSHPRAILIGNSALGSMFNLLGLRAFLPISSPNFHLEEDGVNRIVFTVSTFPEVYDNGFLFLVAAGVSAAVIIDRLYERFPNNFYFDCGSMFDAFCGIGGQREWRAKLYSNPEKLATWQHKNLTGE